MLLRKPFLQSGLHAAVRRLAWAGALAGALISTLSACGDGSDTQPDPVAASAPAAVTTPGAAPSAASGASKHTLLIDLDGATYAAVQRGMADGTLPNLAKLQVQLAYSGGVFGTLGQQPSLDTPGWATLLTGAWADRHQVASDASGQAMKSATVFELAKAKSTGLNGAAVDAAGLAGLLAPLYAANALDNLVDCSADATADTCVTNGALKMIDARYGIVVAQYHGAVNVALNYGQNATQYAAALAKLDTAVGALMAETAKDASASWLVAVTGNHGLSANSQNDGLPLVPESTTFIGLNVKANNGTAGVNAAVPGTLADLYPYASIADVAPTLLAWLDALPAPANYAMDGGELIGAQPVARLAASASTDSVTNMQSITLTWTAPASGEISVLRNGNVIAAGLPAGTAAYTDTADQLATDYTAAGTYKPVYTVVAGDAARGVLLSFTYTPPVPLAASLANNLVVYYPFGATLPASDEKAASTLAPWSSSADGGSVVPSPFGGHALQVDMNAVDGATGLNGYRLMPSSGSDVAAASGSFTIGFWFNAPCLPLGVTNSTDVSSGTTSTAGANHTYPIFANKNYVSGANVGLAIAGNSGGCNIIYNLGDGVSAHRADPAGSQGKGIGLTYSANQWVYIAMAVDATAKTVTAYLFDPLLGKQSTAPTAINSAFDYTKLAGLANGYGLAEDGTGKMTLTICGNPQGSALPALTGGATYKATTCGQFPPVTMAFSDVAMWNTAVSGTDLYTIFQSRKPLSTLLH